MTAAELFKKYWPPNVNRSLWTDEHRHVAEVMFKVAWDYLQSPGEKQMTDKPTIEELEAMLTTPDTKVEIAPDGRVVVHQLVDILEIGRLEAELQSKDVHQEDTDKLLYKEIEQVYELKKEIQSKDERMGEWAEAADGEMSRLQTELQQANEMIELLKASRANGDVLAELVRSAEDMDEQCRTNVKLRAELAQTCNCRFEVDGDRSQTMWCPLHLRLSDD